LVKCGLIVKPMKLSGSLRWRRSEILLFLDCECSMKAFEAAMEDQSDEN
jgi:hypothetical protein